MFLMSFYMFYNNFICRNFISNESSYLYDCSNKNDNDTSENNLSLSIYIYTHNKNL